jgi:uncharacterized protein YecT (DUF1311 family)
MQRATATVCVLIACSLCLSAQSKRRVHSSKAKDCPDTAQTRSALNECAGGKLSKAELELGVLYKRLLAKASNPAHRLKVEAAQTAWIAYRDAELDAKYPAENKQEQYGSVYPMCFADDRVEMTRQRIEELRALQRAEEGDVCAGEWTGPESR